MKFFNPHPVTPVLKEVQKPLDDDRNFQALVDACSGAKVVLLGEASHGTHEYYTWRSRITRKLIEEKGFSFVAVEGDWPDCYKLNRFIKGKSNESRAYDVLCQFHRWPTWMWANWEVSALADWLREHNLEKKKSVGFYGLDVYSLFESLDATFKYLKEKYPEGLDAALEAIRCFEPYREGEGQAYAYATYTMPDPCRDEVVQLLKEMQSSRKYDSGDPEEAFSAEQNALVAKNAEAYYKAMVRSNRDSWNVRDMHMAETLERLLQLHGKDSKAIVWEHNTHVGDARATDMGRAGLVNIGQLARQKYGEENVYIVGFGSYEGSVIAGRKWDDVMRVMAVPPAIEGSWEHSLHEAGAFDKVIFSHDISASVTDSLGHRAIGVVYKPEVEEFGNYVPTIVPERYDAFVFLDRTKALHPIHVQPHGHELPDTYPWGM